MIVAEDVVIEIFDRTHIVATPLMEYTTYRASRQQIYINETEDMDFLEIRPAPPSNARSRTALTSTRPASFSYYARGLNTGLEPCAFASSEDDRKRLEIRLLSMQLYADAEASAAARDTAAKESDLKSSRAKLSPFGLDRRTGLSSKEFQEVYDGVWPVLLADCARDWPALSQWRRERILERFGDRKWLAETTTIISGGEFILTETENMSARELARGIREANASNYLLASDPSFFAERTLNSEGFHISSCSPLRENLLKFWPDSSRPPTAVLQWGSKYSRSNLQVHYR